MEEMHKYKITNTANGPVHIKEMRTAISSGKEREFVGVLTEGTKRLKEKGFVSIEDLGVADMPKRAVQMDPLQRKMAQEEKEKELTKKVRENLEKIRKVEEPKAKVEAVSASEMGVEQEPVPETPKIKLKKKKKSD